MIIKITVDDGVSPIDASKLSDLLIDFYENQPNENIKAVSSAEGMIAKITHISKAGNIFIHVSKVEISV